MLLLVTRTILVAADCSWRQVALENDFHAAAADDDDDGKDDDDDDDMLVVDQQ